MLVTVYTPDPALPIPPCNQCHATRLHLKKENVSFTEVITDESTADNFRDKGYASYPVVVVEGDGEPQIWSGYRRDRIKELADSLR